MGLLDDAIREHLELKKRRGADTAEVARQEQEAFGPPHRGDFEPGAQGATAVAEHKPALDEPATVAEEEAPTALHVVEEPVPAPPPVPAPAQPRSDHADELQEEPPRPHGDPADEIPHLDQPTEAFDAEEVRAATTPPPAAPPVPEVAPEPAPEPEPPAAARPAEEDGDEADDVLEETPEFLQETPEHDRLWFEQRPPRDFDF